MWRPVCEIYFCERYFFAGSLSYARYTWFLHYKVFFWSWKIIYWIFFQLHREELFDILYRRRCKFWLAYHRCNKTYVSHQIKIELATFPRKTRRKYIMHNINDFRWSVFITPRELNYTFTVLFIFAFMYL